MTRPSRRRFLGSVLAAGLSSASLGLMFGCGAAPPEAPRPSRVRRIAFLVNRDDPRAFLEVFREALRDLGYVEGQNVAIDERQRDPNVPNHFAELAAEVVRLEVDVIVVPGTEAAQAARDATATIPIVFTQVGDPVGQGVVASLARPGGNITGFSNVVGQLSGKRLELLKEAIPTVSRVAVLLRTNNPASAARVRGMEDAARSLGIELHVLRVVTPAELEDTLVAATRGGADALVEAAPPFSLLAAELAVKHRLPSISEDRQFVRAGGLMSYGTDEIDRYRRAAGYVDRILKGTSPADLPVEQPTKFDFVVNLRTAQALGLTIPDSILAQATEVIR